MTRIGGPGGPVAPPPPDTGPATAAKHTPSSTPSPGADLFEKARSGLGQIMDTFGGIVFGQPVGSPGTPPSKLGGSDPELLVRNDLQQTPKAETLEMQQKLNEWRTSTGQAPLKEDGFFGPKTEKAVREFQKANGLEPDGKAGVETQNRLLLEAGPGFQKLDGATKTKLRDMTSEQLTLAKKGQLPGDLGTNLQNIRDLAGAPGLSQLSPHHQQQMVETLAKRPDDTVLTGQLTSLANDATFRKLNDATRTEVLKQVASYAGDPAKIENVSKLATAPGFDQLSTTHQKQMLDALAKRPGDAGLADGLGKLAGNVAFRGTNDTVKSATIDALTAKPPLTTAKLDNTTALLGSPSFQKLSNADKALLAEGLKGAKADPAYTANLKRLVENPKFDSLEPAEKTAVLSQVKNYPDARSVANVERMLSKEWFTKQDLGDKQRSLKTVAYLSQYDGGDRKIVDNTLDKFLKGDFKLEWKKLNSGGGTTYGEADHKTKILTLNKDLIAADDAKMVVNGTTKHLTLSTVSHEVNHILNGDEVDDTFQYFEAEYRAWQVGFKARHGREPTNQEAMEQRIRWQLDPASFYGKYAADAMKDPAEAKKFFAFLNKVTGLEVNATNWKTVAASDPSTWKSNPSSPAPVPGGNLDNH